MKYLLLLTLVASTLGQERCKSPKVFEGRCASWLDCPVLETQIDDYTIKELIDSYSGECGGTKNGKIFLCCPVFASTTRPPIPTFPSTTRPPIPTFPSTTRPPIPTFPSTKKPKIPILPGPFLPSKRCQSPKVSEGRCTLLEDCPFLEAQIDGYNIREFVEAYGRCGTRNQNTLLCCPVIPSETRPPIPKFPSTTRPTIPIFPRPFLPTNVCSGKYSLIGGQCLYISTEHTGWSQAQNQCAQDHGTLAVLQNQDKVSRYLKENNLGGPSAWYWVGANDQQTPGTVRWATGGPVHGTWTDHKPWKDQPGQMCVYLTVIGFGRTPCGDDTWYICQSK